jgi:hypothetical protein
MSEEDWMVQSIHSRGILAQKMSEGWEPFAVTSDGQIEKIWLRRRTGG